MVESNRSPSPLSSDHGRTTIASGVVATIAGLAVREVPGVYEVGGRRTLGKVRNVLPGVTADPPSSGVDVEVGDVQAAVDLSLVVNYGVPVVRLAENVRELVIRRVESLTGLEVTEVNITVTDVHLDEDDEPGE